MRVALHSVLREGREAVMSKHTWPFPKTDPANERWQAFISQYVDHFVTTGNGPDGMILERVWNLAQQRDGADPVL